ncbi:PQQ-binding-like beta-propeller repeat protein [Planctomycetota bacterium]
MRRLSLLAIVIVGCVLTTRAFAGDWPQYRYDAGRTAASAESLAAELHLAWTRELPTPRPAFPTEIRIRYDATYEPVVLGSTMFVPSMVTDTVIALDTETGDQRWQFFTEGPVRFAPVAWEDKVYFVSDDGHLYCVAAGDGKLLWKFRGLPADREDRKVMGNERLVSLYPARGGPVLADGVVYFGAGIWCGEGVFLYAVDATSGKAVWSNVDSGQIEKANMDHGVAHYAGISPQGHLAIVDGKLIVPNGAQLPAIADLKTGELAPYTMGWGGRVGLAKGCAFVAGTGKYLIHGGDLYDLHQTNQEQFRQPRKNDFKSMLYMAGLLRLQIDPANQKALGEFREPVLTADAMYLQQGGVAAYNLTKPTVEERAKAEIPDFRRNDQYPDKMRATFPELWKLASKSKVHIKAGDRLYCSRVGLVEAVDVPKDGAKPKVAWQTTIEGTPHRMLAADGKLFVVTREGRIYAFGPDERTDPPIHAVPSAPSPEPDVWTEGVARLIERAKITDGYALVLGVGTGRLAEEIVRQSQCDVIAVDPDADKVARLRAQFQKAGLYGSRIAICVGEPMSYPLPPYLASLVVSEDMTVLGDAVDAPFVKSLFRCLRPYGGTMCMPIQQGAFAEAASACKLAGADVGQTDHLAWLSRPGPLPESADWSHHGANAANTGASRDHFLKAPLFRLWFDSSFRWFRTPGTTAVRVVGGRVLVKLNDKLRAIDVYTGRHLWEAAVTPAPGLDGGLVAVDDGIYLAAGRSCVVLDPATGSEKSQFSLPDDVEGNWSSIRVAGDQLVGASVKVLVCMDRHTGKLLWKRACERRVGSIALGGGKVFSTDYVARRRGQPEPDTSGMTTRAFDAATGEPLWEVPGHTEVRYSEPHDLVVTASGVYQAADGSRVWNSGGPWPITEKLLLSGTSGGFTTYDLLTGAKSEKKLAWNKRGCTLLRASSTMLTTRYFGNASYVDLASGEFTSIWNVRAACSNNLFPANGVLNLPNLSGGCTCNYMPISQAFVPTSVME